VLEVWTARPASSPASSTSTGRRSTGGGLTPPVGICEECAMEVWKQQRRDEGWVDAFRLAANLVESVTESGGEVGK